VSAYPDIGACYIAIDGEVGRSVHFNLTVKSPDGRSVTYADETKVIVPDLYLEYEAVDPTTTPTCSLSAIYYV
jgi:predicted thioesterase